MWQEHTFPAFALNKAAHALTRVLPPDLVLVGDSITAFGPWWKLGNPLRTITLAQSRVELRQMVSQMWQAEAYRPRCIHFMGGSNDVGNPRLTDAAIVEDYRDLLGEVNGTRLVVTLMPKQADPDVSDRIGWLNRVFRLLAESKGATVIDLNPIIAPRGVLERRFRIDTTHFSAEAYRVWFGELRGVL